MIPLAALPVAAFFSFYFFIERRLPTLDPWQRRGEAFTAACAVWAVYLTLVTEFLNLFRAIHVPGLTLAWAVPLICLTRIKFDLSPVKRDLIHPGDRSSDLSPVKCSLEDKLYLTAIIALAAITALAAWFAAPNTWDSHTYHMARVAHWAQNQSIAHYITAEPRQFYHPPWAEFAILHFQVLTKGDQFSNLVGWFSMIASLITCGLLTARFGGNRRTVLFSMFITASIPVGILLASSTKNDYVAAFWILAFVYYLFKHHEEPSRWTVAALGACLGIALLTKGFSFIYLIPYLIWLAYGEIRRHSFLKGGRRIAAVIALALALNSGHLIRNIWLCGPPGGPEWKTSVPSYLSKSHILDLPGFISVTALSVLDELESPFEPVNRILNQILIGTHRLIGRSISDPRSTFDVIQYRVTHNAPDETSAGNPAHTVLIIASLFGTLLSTPSRRMNTYLLLLISSFFLFCLMIKWTPYHNRMHLPLYLLWAPVIAAFLTSLSLTWMPGTVAGILLLSAAYTIRHNANQPFFGNDSIFSTPRRAQYFKILPRIREDYEAAAKAIREGGYRNVGLIIESDHWDYPFWVCLKSLSPAPRIEHIRVRNISEKLSPAGFVPDAVIVTRMDSKLMDELSGKFRRSLVLRKMVVFADPIV